MYKCVISTMYPSSQLITTGRNNLAHKNGNIKSTAILSIFTILSSQCNSKFQEGARLGLW